MNQPARIRYAWFEPIRRLTVDQAVRKTTHLTSAVISSCILIGQCVCHSISLRSYYRSVRIKHLAVGSEPLTKKGGLSRIWWSRLHRGGLETTWFGITRWKLEDGGIAKSVSRRFSWSVEINVMWWLALMMFTSPAFPFIVFMCMGLSEAVHSYDALPLVLRKSRAIAEEHQDTSANEFPGYRLGIVALTPAPTIASATKPINVAAPATTDPTTTPSLSNPSYMAAFDRRKLSSVQTQMKETQISDKKGIVPDFSTTSDNSQGEFKWIAK